MTEWVNIYQGQNTKLQMFHCLLFSLFSSKLRFFVTGKYYNVEPIEKGLPEWVQSEETLSRASNKHHFSNLHCKLECLLLLSIISLSPMTKVLANWIKREGGMLLSIAFSQVTNQGILKGEVLLHHLPPI